MNADTIARLLENSGFHNIRITADYVSLEDPSCIVRSFETFAEYAYFIILFFTGLMLFGWAVSLLRGGTNNYMSNFKNLFFIFCVLSLSRPIMNFIYGGDLFALGCQTITVPMDDMERLLAARQDRLPSDDMSGLYEEFDIFDSGAPLHEVPYSDAPVTSAGEPADLQIK